MNLVDRVRLENAVWSYSFWLDLRFVTFRRRRQLRSELRANLHDAAERTDARTAISGLGSIRAMAVDAVPFDSTRPRWYAGVQMGLVALVVVWALQVLAMIAWVDGVKAAVQDAERTVTGSLPFFPGSFMKFEQQVAPNGFSVTLEPGWGAFVVAALVLVVVARPWRLRAARDRHLTPA